MAEINIEEFYRNYSEIEMKIIKSIIDDVLKDVDDSNVMQKANSLADTGYNKYPEIQYYRVNLLIRAGKINKAYKVASNYLKFKPLKAIADELKTKILSLESERKSLIDNIAKVFIKLCPELDYETVYNEIKKYEYEDIAELDSFISKIASTKEMDKIIEYLKDSHNTRFIIMQYFRIRCLLLTGNNKGINLLKQYTNRPLFIHLVDNSFKEFCNNEIDDVKLEVENDKKEETKEETKEEIKEETKEEQKEEIKEETKEEQKEEIKEETKNYDNSITSVYDKSILSVLLTKLYVDNLTLDEINSSEIADFLKVIFTLAYYEKYSLKQGEKYLKEKIKTYKRKAKANKKVKILNSFLPRFTGKGKLFDIGIYQEVVRVPIYFSEIDKYRKVEVKKEEPKKEEKKEVVKEVTPKITPVEEVKPKYITSSSVSKPTPQSIKVQIVPETVKEIKKVKLQKKKPQIKDIMYDDYIEVGLAVYRQMCIPEQQKKAIKAWDVLESMFSKESDNQEALEKVVSFLEKIDNNSNSDINLPGIYKKYSK